MFRRNFWTSLTDLEPGMMKSLGSSGDGFRNWKSPILVSSSREIPAKIGKQFNHLGDWWIVVDPKNTYTHGVMKFACALSLTQDKGIVLTHVMVKGKTGVAYKWFEIQRFTPRSTMLDCLWISVLCHFWRWHHHFLEDFFEHVSHVKRNSRIPWHL